jgi:hypothetical protein
MLLRYYFLSSMTSRLIYMQQLAVITLYPQCLEVSWTAQVELNIYIYPRNPAIYTVDSFISRHLQINVTPRTPLVLETLTHFHTLPKRRRTLYYAQHTTHDVLLRAGTLLARLARRRLDMRPSHALQLDPDVNERRAEPDRKIEVRLCKGECDRIVRANRVQCGEVEGGDEPEPRHEYLQAPGDRLLVCPSACMQTRKGACLARVYLNSDLPVHVERDAIFVLGHKRLSYDLAFAHLPAKPE